MSIRQKIFDYVQRRHPRTAVYHSYDSVKRVLILFESDVQERNLQVKALARQLQNDGKEVAAWGYIDRKQAVSAVLRDYRVLGQKDLTIWGWPKEYELQDISKEHYDLLIDLNMSGSMPLRYLSVYANVDFRAGRQTDEPYLSDFMVEVGDEQNPAFLFDQIVGYLKMIKDA